MWSVWKHPALRWIILVILLCATFAFVIASTE
jgi:hypothetical protein